MNSHRNDEIVALLSLILFFVAAEVAISVFTLLHFS